ncbi:MAG: hypothetical protein E4H00_10825, partial [Myxococcales bacterium]
DVVLLIGAAIYVVEFKVGAANFWSSSVSQVTDYALDLKNFHDASHERWVVPVLIALCANIAETTSSSFITVEGEEEHDVKGRRTKWSALARGD